MPKLSAVPASPLPEGVDLSQLPRRCDRRTAAEIVTRHAFPVSPRTIEAWPVPSRQINGRALYETAELLAYAQAKVDNAAKTMGGRRGRQTRA